MNKLKYQVVCRVEFEAADDADARFRAKMADKDFQRLRDNMPMIDMTVKLQRLEQGEPPTGIDMD
jgi:hypothetical protein